MKNNSERMDSLSEMGERPLRLSSDVRIELDGLFAPMERSIASSVMVAVAKRRSRVRSWQAIGLGLSPAMAIMVVVMLYISCAVVPARAEWARSGMVMTTSGAGNEVEGAAPKDLMNPAYSMTQSVSVARSQMTLNMSDDPVRLQIIAWWLRASHPDIAEELAGAEHGSAVSFVLESGEVTSFASVMSIYGFTGQTTWGLRILPGSAASVWSLALTAASDTVCFIP